MSAITKNNIVSGIEVCTAFGLHKFQSKVTYSLVVNGKTEEVVRQTPVINCCTKIGTKHNYIKYEHRPAGTFRLSSSLKSHLAQAENAKKHAYWILVSRKRISPAPAPVAIVKAAPKPTTAIVKAVPKPPANPLQLTGNSLQTQISGLKNSNVALSKTVGVQNELIVALKAEAASFKVQIDATNGTIAALRGQLAVIPALQQQITQLEGQVANLTQILGNILISIQNNASQ